ncbi:hypothetical protein I302_103388 [Kwoniella bestiolae CBS 10118]|uniref:Myotubularin n=1 Tax=Kwoniella bestiolae CBS 10118 TaxID=1296100 RepID=A0A1B9G899_9TREE|nr:myotubularin [Kwoniella bestiolae CBS 10118]OCF27249.1 myotubularin [Kwoniella bestiolae CBS 10118]
MDTIRIAKVDNVILEHYIPPTTSNGQPSKVRKTGGIHLTPHHLIFCENPAPVAGVGIPGGSSSSSNIGGVVAGTSSSSIASTTSKDKQNKNDEIWIPYPTITLLTKLPQSIQGHYPLKIETKHFENYVFLFEKDRSMGKSGGAEDVWQSIKDSAVKTSVEQLHAFFYTPPHSHSTRPLPSSSSTIGGWATYNPRNEFARQGLGSKTKSWRFTDINKDYSFSPTYPNKMVVPTKISDSTLSYASKYRSKGRIPVLSYLHWGNNASITRSSQPMVGLKNSRSAQDERLVECIFSSHQYPEAAYSAPVYGATTTNLIIDARPTTNAMANVAMGAGTENMENYKLGKKAYLGIDNIHVMRNSLKIIIEAIREAESKPSGILDRTLLRRSNWLKHLSTILDGSLMIIRNIHLNASHVLIHCSDGWDRTAQLSAISQICLDPYYRTIEGFNVLVEKDFLSFGHKFMDRSNHLSSERYFILSENNDQESDESDEENGGEGATKAAQAFFASVQKQFTNSTASTSHLKEISPVFHQFLDCVRQIQRQFPERFEFNEQYLLEIYYHLYSCQFGTFLFNNERQKSQYTTQTTSIWDHATQNKSVYINKEFDGTLDKKAEGDQGVLLFDPKDVKFWFRLFKRGDEEMNGSPVLLQQQAQGVDVVGPITSSLQDPATLSLPVPGTTNPVRSVSPLPPQAHTLNNASGSGSESNTPIKRGLTTSPPVPGGGWNWQGAFNVVQSAGRQIKNISQDAYNQLKAEAVEVDDPWGSVPDSRSSGSGEMVHAASGGINGLEERKEYRTYTPRTNFRIPSESNPWSSSSNSTSVHGPAPVIPSTSSHARPSTNRVNSNPWSTTTPDRPATSTPTLLAPEPNTLERKISPSLADLTLNDKYSTTTQIPKTATDSSSKTEDEEMVRAAMGDDKKAWDPLGAL